MESKKDLMKSDKVYCSQCHFISGPHMNSLHYCTAPSNIEGEIEVKNKYSWLYPSSPITVYIDSPENRNKNNNCPDFQTAYGCLR